jgi:hypothetical protein
LTLLETDLTNFASTNTVRKGAKVDRSNFCNKLLTTDFYASQTFLRYADLIRDEVIFLRRRGGNRREKLSVKQPFGSFIHLSLLAYNGWRYV